MIVDRQGDGARAERLARRVLEQHLEAKLLGSALDNGAFGGNHERGLRAALGIGLGGVG